MPLQGLAPAYDLAQRSAAPLLIGLLALCGLLPVAAQGQTVEQIDFELRNDSTVAAEKWTLQVPDNRSADSSRAVPLRFVRFESRAEKPGPPIIYLAGGPGGSGTRAARGERWALFDRLRDLANIIALDQRGTGLSDRVPGCESTYGMPPDSATTRAVYTRIHRKALRQCLSYWENEGVDIRGYTTWESAADIEAVRKAVGAEQVSLLGISYGTHLALAALKRYPGHVDRLVLASPEGLGQTVKLPARHDAFLGRVQEAINADSVANARYPDVRGLIRGVLDQIEADPPQFAITDNDTTFTRTLGRFEAQLMTGYMMSDPGGARYMLSVYARAAEGNYSGFERLLGWFGDPTVEMSGMSEAMDIASGISSSRLAQVQAQADTALAGDAMNFPMPHLRESISGIDLGTGFRAPVRSDRPTLLLSGTLDGRTFPAAHREIARHLPNGAIVTIENAGHNLFFSHPQVVPMIAEFFAGAPAEPRTLMAPRPAFRPRN
ncbi:alpha/beta hydrolase [Salinibacter grassmerensis]|uniref:alpha/beta hydrolase n=1 Tax=Salinibacter grassmerensis TaxID=3040353 RepID=UPI0021E7B7F7|nr:alpha/beta hydrolase [Salinibacter grassmerensis]